MFKLIISSHIIVSVLIIILVLSQQGKGANLGTSVISGSSQTIFGSRGASTFMFRLTTFFLGIFFATSLTLNFINKSTNTNNIDRKLKEIGITQDDYRSYNTTKLIQQKNISKN